jgi:hypothetical protein
VTKHRLIVEDRANRPYSPWVTATRRLRTTPQFPEGGHDEHCQEVLGEEVAGQGRAVIGIGVDRLTALIEICGIIERTEGSSSEGFTVEAGRHHPVDPGRAEAGHQVGRQADDEDRIDREAVNREREADAVEADPEPADLASAGPVSSSPSEHQAVRHRPCLLDHQPGRHSPDPSERHHAQRRRTCRQTHQAFFPSGTGG